MQNVTDIDDPLLERANRDGVDWRELAASQTALFHADMEALNVLAPEHYIGAVEAIPWIVPEVEKLIAAGLAYPLAGTHDEPDGDIYFSVEAASAASHVGGLVQAAPAGTSSAPSLPNDSCRGHSPSRAAAVISSSRTTRWVLVTPTRWVTLPWRSTIAIQAWWALTGKR